MIVTLAGHVDHGKTTLVRQLTGVDTDRLAEERRRGLTIDIGFAYLEENDVTLGFVDVPGHHRFIHNMVAGVASMQFALLVIAADDGPMPQSREHLQILQLIGVQAGLIALTKCDRVGPERLAAAKAEIAKLVDGSFLQGAPVVETSSETGVGINALKQMLLDAARGYGAEENDKPFRMAIDRAFTLRGSGLVVTGTVHSGSISNDQEVFLFPGGSRGRVRSLHAQNKAAKSAVVGDRTALNLTGLEGAAISRGQWLSAVPQDGHRCLVLEMTVLEDFPRPVRHWTPVHVYHATTHSTGRLALLEGNRLEPGAKALVEIVADEPLLAKHGDRLVIRDQGLDRTLGGGTLVDNRKTRGRRRDPERLAALSAYAQADPQSCLHALLDIGPVRLGDFAAVWDLSEDQLRILVENANVEQHGGEALTTELWNKWRQTLLVECEARHRDDPALQGLQENEFDRDVPPRFRSDLLNTLVADDRLEQQAGRFRPKQHKVVLAPEEEQLFKRLEPLLDQPQPPSVGDIGKAMGIALPLLQRGIKSLASKKVVVQINDKRVYLPGQVQPLVDIAEALSQQGPFTARQFRDAAEIGRNVAIDILEYFDAKGFTRRNGDHRTVVGTAERALPAD